MRGEGHPGCGLSGIEWMEEESARCGEDVEPETALSSAAVKVPSKGGDSDDPWKSVQPLWRAI